MGCCGEQNIIDNSIPVGEAQTGDVEAMALWHGNHVEHGRATGRTYPRMSWPRITWVDPRDIRKSPNLWKAIEKPIEPVNGNGHTPEPDMQYEGVEGLADALMDAGIIDIPFEEYPKPDEVEETDVQTQGIIDAAPMNEPGRLSPQIPLFTPNLYDIKPDYKALVNLGKALYAD